MAISPAFDSGTQSATVGTEHTLSSISTAGVFQLVVDLSNLAAGDVVEIRHKRRVLSGGTLLGAGGPTLYVDAQAAEDAVHESAPFGNDLTSVVGVEFTLKQVAGTAKSFPWKVLNYG